MSHNKKNISFYKLEKLAQLSLKNAIRLHFDSILLYKNKSYPSAFQLSVLALEEIGKAKELEVYYFHSKFDSGPMEPKDEEKYLGLHFSHQWKQKAFLARELFDYSPAYVKLIEEKKLEWKKQKATYVGLKLNKGKVDFSSRIHAPFSFSSKDAKQQISLINDALLDMCNVNMQEDGVFWIEGMNDLIDNNLHNMLKHNWKFRSQLKSRRWYSKLGTSKLGTVTYFLTSKTTIPVSIRNSAFNFHTIKYKNP
ncbi:MAG: AbiV family abortive infection protein [Planctomycetota bacterium]|jgi:AbiV family abortive infection protein